MPFSTKNLFIGRQRDYATFKRTMRFYQPRATLSTFEIVTPPTCGHSPSYLSCMIKNAASWYLEKQGAPPTSGSLHRRMLSRSSKKAPAWGHAPAAEMLRTWPDPDEAGGNLPQNWKPFQQTNHQR